MRIWYAVAAAWFVVFATPSGGLAQVTYQLPRDVQITPEQTIPGIVPTPRVFLPTEAEREVARKVALVRTFGLLITDAAALQPSFWLTPRQPWVSSGAGLTISNEFQTTPTYAATAAMPHGFITMAANPPRATVLDVLPFSAGTPLNTVNLIDVPSDPRDWLLVECIVSGAQRYNLVEGPSPGRSTATGDRVAAVFRPSTAAQRRFVLDGYIRRENPEDHTRWQFGGCEITPVRG